MLKVAYGILNLLGLLVLATGGLTAALLFSSPYFVEILIWEITEGMFGGFTSMFGSSVLGRKFFKLARTAKHQRRVLASRDYLEPSFSGQMVEAPKEFSTRATKPQDLPLRYQFMLRQGGSPRQSRNWYCSKCGTANSARVSICLSCGRASRRT